MRCVCTSVCSVVCRTCSVYVCVVHVVCMCVCVWPLCACSVRGLLYSRVPQNSSSVNTLNTYISTLTSIIVMFLHLLTVHPRTTAHFSSLYNAIHDSTYHT